MALVPLTCMSLVVGVSPLGKCRRAGRHRGAANRNMATLAVGLYNVGDGFDATDQLTLSKESLMDAVAGSFSIYCGLDVGKENHHAVGLDAGGHRVFDKQLPQNEDRLRELFTDLSQHGQIVVIVDQPYNIGALAVAVAQDVGAQVAYLPGLAMRRFADLHAGNAKTDARDAFIIAEAARTMPSALRSISVADEQMADLRMLAGHDDDLAADATRITNRIRGVLVDVHPALERALGPHLDQRVGPALLAKFGGPMGIAAASRASLRSLLRKHAPRAYGRIQQAITDALAEQTVVIAGSNSADQVLKTLGAQLGQIMASRAALEEQFVAELDAHPLGTILTSMPGIGVRTGMKILIEISDLGRFESAGHLAAYAGLAPRTHRSGTSIKGEHRQRAGNKRLKKAMFRAAFASLADPDSRAYYDRKRAQGKRHNAAILCLARRRSDVLYAMLRDRRHYQKPENILAAAA